MSQPGGNPFMDEIKREAFLQALRDGKTREQACGMVGASYAQLRYYVQHHNPRFDHEIHDSLDAARDEVVAHARRQALGGDGGDVAWANVYDKMSKRPAAPKGDTPTHVTIELSDPAEKVRLQRELERRAIQEGEVVDDDDQ